MVKATKVVICGLKGIGKTTYIEKLLYGENANPDVWPTIEDIYVASVDTERGIKEVVRIYDTEGMSTDITSDIPTLRPYYTTADAFVLMYRLDNRTSFDILDMMRKDIERNREKREILITIVGIAGRDNEQKEVDPTSAIGWATREKLRHFEVRLGDRRSLVTPFLYIASRFNQPQPKSSFAPLGIGVKKVKE